MVDPMQQDEGAPAAPKTPPATTNKGLPQAAWRLTLPTGGDGAEEGQSNWKYQKKSKGVGKPAGNKWQREGKGDNTKTNSGASSSTATPTAAGDQENKKQEVDNNTEHQKDNREKQWGAGAGDNKGDSSGGANKDKKGKWIKSQDRNLHNLLNLLVKSNLQNHQKVRDLQGRSTMSSLSPAACQR